MPCRCKSNMNFADANYLYQNRRRCPFAPARPSVECQCEDTETETSACTCDTSSTESTESTENTENTASSCCQCCSCVDQSCYETVEIPCTPIDCRAVERQLEYRVCCNPNGTCCRYPCCCRNRFWPNFAHPRWLCCADLYNVD